MKQGHAFLNVMQSYIGLAPTHICQDHGEDSGVLFFWKVILLYPSWIGRM